MEVTPANSDAPMGPSTQESSGSWCRCTDPLCSCFELDMRWKGLVAPLQSCCEQLHSISVKLQTSPTLKHLTKLLNASASELRATYLQLSQTWNRFSFEQALPLTLLPLQRPHSLLLACVRSLKLLQAAAIKQGLTQKQLAKHLYSCEGCNQLVKLYDITMSITATMAKLRYGDSADDDLSASDRAHAATTQADVRTALQEGLLEVDLCLQPVMEQIGGSPLYLCTLLLVFAQQEADHPTLFGALSSSGYLQNACRTFAQHMRGFSEFARKAPLNLDTSHHFLSVLLHVLHSADSDARELSALKTQLTASPQLRELAVSMMHAAATSDDFKKVFRLPPGLQLLGEPWSPTYDAIAVHIAAAVLFHQKGNAQALLTPITSSGAQLQPAASFSNPQSKDSIHHHGNPDKSLFAQWVTLKQQMGPMIFLWPYDEGGLISLLRRLPASKRFEAAMTMVKTAVNELQLLADGMEHRATMEVRDAVFEHEWETYTYQRAWQLIQEALASPTGRAIVATNTAPTIQTVAERLIRCAGVADLRHLAGATTLLHTLLQLRKEPESKFLEVTANLSLGLMSSVRKLLQRLQMAYRLAGRKYLSKAATPGTDTKFTTAGSVQLLSDAAEPQPAEAHQRHDAAEAAEVQYDTKFPTSMPNANCTATTRGLLVGAMQAGLHTEYAASGGQAAVPQPTCSKLQVAPSEPEWPQSASDVAEGDSVSLQSQSSTNDTLLHSTSADGYEDGTAAHAWMLPTCIAAFDLLAPLMSYWMGLPEHEVPEEGSALIVQACECISTCRWYVDGWAAVDASDQLVCDAVQRLTGIVAVLAQHEPAVMDQHSRMMVVATVAALIAVLQSRHQVADASAESVHAVGRLLDLLADAPDTAGIAPCTNVGQLKQLLQYWLDPAGPAVTSAMATTAAHGDVSNMVGPDECGMQPSVGCWNRRCTNLSGSSEADLETHRCKGCMTARYCCYQCYEADWQLHSKLCKVRRAQSKKHKARNAIQSHESMQPLDL